MPLELERIFAEIDECKNNLKCIAKLSYDRINLY